MSASTPREIELKLDLAPADAVTLRTRILPGLGRGGVTERLVSVYYDTRRHRLNEAGMTVRLRHIGDRRVQTVKAGGGASAGLFDRSEWECEVAGDALDHEALAETPVASLLRKGAGSLKPLFETVIERTIWTVETTDWAVEVALDEGEVRAGAAIEPLSELELELKRGRPADLFAMIGHFDGLESLRIGALSKSERGYRLLARQPARAAKADPVSLTRGMTVAEAFRAIMRNGIRQFRLNEPLVTTTRDPEALHQARVAMRRLRSALSLFRDVVADERTQDLKDRLRDISQALGDARNLDVYIAASATPEAEREPAEPGLGALLADMEARRTRAYDDVEAMLASWRFRTLMIDLLAWVETGAWVAGRPPVGGALRDQPVAVFAASLLAGRRRTVKRKGRSLDTLDSHARHRVRIAAKTLRYAAEFFADLTRGGKERERHAAFITALSALQEHLGELNDMQTAHDLALTLAGEEAAGGLRPGAAPASFAAAHVSGEGDARVPDLLQAAAEAHATLSHGKRFWSSWAD